MQNTISQSTGENFLLLNKLQGIEKKKKQQIFFLLDKKYWAYGRHGIKQLRTGWSDGPAYVTQCPIQTGQSYVYNFTITGQRGTLLWHAHITWLRATVHGAIVILPKRGIPYPFPKPDKEKIIILGKFCCAIINSTISQT